MNLISLLIWFFVLAFALWIVWLIIEMIPGVPAGFKQITLAIIGFIALIAILQQFGLFGSEMAVIPRAH